MGSKRIKGFVIGSVVTAGGLFLTTVNPGLGIKIAAAGMAISLNAVKRGIVKTQGKALSPQGSPDSALPLIYGATLQSASVLMKCV